MLEAGMRGVDIISKIQDMCYRNSDGTVRHYITDWKKRRKRLYVSDDEADVIVELVERKDVFKLLFHSLEKVERISKDIFDRVCAEYPCFQNLNVIIWEFRDLLKAKNPDELASWIERAKSLKIREIDSFVEGVKRDYEAVFNAIKFNYSNGLAEQAENNKRVKILRGEVQKEQGSSTPPTILYQS